MGSDGRLLFAVLKSGPQSGLPPEYGVGGAACRRREVIAHLSGLETMRERSSEIAVMLVLSKRGRRGAAFMASLGLATDDHCSPYPNHPWAWYVRCSEVQVVHMFKNFG